MANVEINFAEIIKNLKELSSFKFFIILVIITIGFIAYLFRDELGTTLREISVKDIEFVQLKNFIGLEDNLDKLIQKYLFSEGYIVYLYQPKEKSFYKEMIITNSDLVKTTSSLQGFYLDEQKELNEKLLNSEYVILDQSSVINRENYLHELGINYLLVRRIRTTEGIIGEIQIILNKQPSDNELNQLKKDLTQIIYQYVL